MLWVGQARSHALQLMHVSWFTLGRHRETRSPSQEIRPKGHMKVHQGR